MDDGEVLDALQIHDLSYADVRRLSTRPFKWTKQRQLATLILAHGYTNGQTAARLGLNEKTIRRWYACVDFAAEVDRLTLMVGIATRSERLRIAMKVIRQKTKEDGRITTHRDSLDWLRFAQSETDGAKLDLAALLESLAGSEEGVTQELPAAPEDAAANV